MLVDLFGQRGERLTDGADGPIQLGSRRTSKTLVPVEDLAKGLEGIFGPGVQLHLELIEPAEGSAVDLHLDRVDAEVGRRVAVHEAANSPHLANREQLYEGRVAAQLQNHRACGRGGPIGRRRVRVGRTLELLATVQPAFRGFSALEADHGFSRSPAQPRCEAGSCESPVRRVDVAVLDLHDPDLTCRLELAQLGRDQVAIGAVGRLELVLHLDFDLAPRDHLAPPVRDYALGSREPAPAWGRLGATASTAMEASDRALRISKVSIVPGTPVNSSVRW